MSTKKRFRPVPNQGVRWIRFGQPKDYSEQIEFRYTQRKKKNTRGAFGS